MSDLIVRSYPLDDINVNGDGRTVTAYCAVFDVEQEIHDQHGDYMERNSPRAFSKALQESGMRAKVRVFYNHALTIHGTPSEIGSVPIGTPVEIVADGRGLKTVTRFNKTPLAEATLEAIRDGGITGYSYTGKIIKSNPARTPRVRPGQPLPVVTRMELGLKEYGPTPLPYYESAEILSVRSRRVLAADELSHLSEAERAALLDLLSATPERAGDNHSHQGAGTGEPRLEAHSARNRRAIRMRIAEAGVSRWR